MRFSSAFRDVQVVPRSAARAFECRLCAIISEATWSGSEHCAEMYVNRKTYRRGGVRRLDLEGRGKQPQHQLTLATLASVETAIVEAWPAHHRQGALLLHTE